MKRALDAQTLGSIVVIGTFTASEAAAHLLAACPGSPFAWYVNLGLFAPFEYARAQGPPLRLLFGPASLSVGVALLVVACLAWWRRSRFAVALIANLGFVFSSAFAYEWIGGSLSGRQSASLAPIGFGLGSGVAVVGLMLAASCLGFCVSHVSFVGAIARERDARRAAGSVAEASAPARLPQRPATSIET